MRKGIVNLDAKVRKEEIGKGHSKKIDMDKKHGEQRPGAGKVSCGDNDPIPSNPPRGLLAKPPPLNE
jgi:hypothetical protein